MPASPCPAPMSSAASGSSSSGDCPSPACPPSGFSYRQTRVRGVSRQPCPRFPSGRCRQKWHFSTTFSLCFLSQPPFSALLPVFLIFVDWQVPGKTAYCHHLLDFVISRPASEASLTGPAPFPAEKVPTKVAFHRHLLDFDLCPNRSRHGQGFLSELAPQFASSGKKGYQIMTRSDSGRYIGSPSEIPNASKNCGKLRTATLTRFSARECTSSLLRRAFSSSVAFWAQRWA